MAQLVTQGEGGERALSNDVLVGRNGSVEAVEGAVQRCKDAVEGSLDAETPTKLLEAPLCTTSTSTASGDSDDEFAVRYSAAQLKAKVAQAKYEVKLAMDAELLAVRKELVERRYEVLECARERDKVTAQCEALQKRLDAVLHENKQMASGTREDLQLEKLLATLDVEKATRQKLQQDFEKQRRELLLAKDRVEKLDLQIANYQKTETVLAQSVAHLQHRFTMKDQQRAVSAEHVQRELIEKYEQDMAALREELATARRTEKMGREQVQELQKELHVVRDNVRQASVSTDHVVARERELQDMVAQLEMEKTELQYKAEQAQKANAQLRSQLSAQREELSSLRHEKEGLQRDNKELGEIASDLMQMAERQYAENVKRGTAPARSTDNSVVDTTGNIHEEDGIFLRKRKKRLRLSLG
ncbi:unnamed protein product [Hyaloperonospora brassicae]|uniref:Uncharacterized protein n=1 Tax=Hyaloperonospora brassicae TaxID=162125 RepID=A0AAV0SXA4_HYABA|nr:unnamed protein product [Hyaloperonospora brassicae]